MNPLVAPEICRFTVNATYGGRAVANILDMRIEPAGFPTSRAEAIADQAAVIVSAWADEICDVLNGGYEAQSVSWLDLDSLSGSTGSTAVGTGTDFPRTGQDAGAYAPGNVSMRLLRNTVAVRGQRQGRMYLAGMPESFTTAASANTLQASAITAINAAAAAFLAAINQDGGVDPPVYDSRLVVVHTTIDKHGSTDPDDWTLEYQGSSEVTSLTADPTLASQRRRLRG